MPSFRSRVYRFFLSKSYNWSKPIPKLRKELERNARWLKVAKDVEIAPVNTGDFRGEWIRPNDAGKERAMLYLHGGGYVMGSCNTHRALVSRIAKASKLSALLIEYRLAPEHPFPAALEDSIAAYTWLLKEGFSPENIIIAGDSAGGGLTLATLVSLRDNNHPLPSAAVCISPWTDLAATGESMQTRARFDPYLDPEFSTASYYVGDSDPCLPLISPLYADLSDLPPLLIHVGTDDIFLSDSTRIADRATKAGVSVTIKIWDNMWHAFHAWASLMPEADQAVEEIGTYLKGRSQEVFDEKGRDENPTLAE